MKRPYFIYILTNRKNGVLYIGVTNDLIRRIEEHRKALVSGFTKKYKLRRLVYYEAFDYVNDAIYREKELKNWHRQWKINLINQHNPEWKDLSQDFDV